jgi:hypothetical protein
MAGRVTQLVVEAVIAPTSVAVRVTQVAVEAVISPTSAAVLTTQLVVEAVIAPTSQNLVVSQAGLEVARYGDPFLLVSQAGLEVLWVGTPNLLVSQAGIEVAYENPKGTFTLDARTQPIGITKTFGTKSVFYGYSGAPIVIKQGARGPAVEFVIPGCDLTIAGSPITISWDVWQSHFQWSVDKKEIVYIRRDGLTGLAIWHDDPQKDETDAGNNATGRQWHFYGSYTETARSGRYVLTVKPAKGNATLYASEIHFTLATPGDGPGITLDAVIGETRPGTFRLKARILQPSGPIAMIDDGTADAVIKGTRSGSVEVGATLFIYGLGAFITRAWVQKPISSSFSVSSLVRIVPEASLTAGAILGQTATGSFALDALRKGSHFYVSAYKSETVGGVTIQVGSLTADAAIFRNMTSLGQVWVQSGWADPVLYEPTVYISAILGKTPTPTFGLDAVVLGPQSFAAGIDAIITGPRTMFLLGVDAFFAGFTTIDAFIKNLGVCVWTTPGDSVVIGQNETLAFLIPVAGQNMHFEIQLDRVASFDSPELRVVESHRHLAGWEYWDGVWVPIPQAGVDPSFVGNEARYTVQEPLVGGLWYRRVRAGVI